MSTTDTVFAAQAAIRLSSHLQAISEHLHDNQMSNDVINVLNQLCFHPDRPRRTDTLRRELTGKDRDTCEATNVAAQSRMTSMSSRASESGRQSMPRMAVSRLSKRISNPGADMAVPGIKLDILTEDEDEENPTTPSIPQEQPSEASKALVSMSSMTKSSTTSSSMTSTTQTGGFSLESESEGKSGVNIAQAAVTVAAQRDDKVRESTAETSLVDMATSAPHVIELLISARRVLQDALSDLQAAQMLAWHHSRAPDTATYRQVSSFRAACKSNQEEETTLLFLCQRKKFVWWMSPWLGHFVSRHLNLLRRFATI